MSPSLFFKIKTFIKIGRFILFNPSVLFSHLDRSNSRVRAEKIHIIYRHVHMKYNERSRDPNKSRPLWFSYEKCFESLLNSIEKSALVDRITLTIVYDGSQAEFESDCIYKYCSPSKKFPFFVKIVEAGSNVKSWHEAIAIAKIQEFADSDLIYFMENDYLHSIDWVEKITELCDSQIPFDYVSLYDHTDMYNFINQSVLPVHGRLKSKIYVTKTHHWRVSPSTCGTFIVRKKVFFEDFEAWTGDLADHYVFTFLSKIKNRVLITPIPGLATHCMDGQLSPTINWGPDDC